MTDTDYHNDKRLAKLTIKREDNSLSQAEEQEYHLLLAGWIRRNDPINYPPTDASMLLWTEVDKG